MKTRIKQPHTSGTPVVTDSRTFPPTQRDLVIASLLARPDAYGSKRTGSAAVRRAG